LDLNGNVRARIARAGTIWDGRFSPDGKSVAFSSDETGRNEIYVQPLAGGMAPRVSLEGGRWPNWISDGRRIVFMTPNGKVQEATLDANGQIGARRTLFTVQSWRRSTFDDRGVGFLVVGDGARYIVRQSPSGIAVAYVQNWSLMR
jgi:Tol biopolymer transport system component